MKIIICGPAIDAETEKKLDGASPAAGRFLNNMVEALIYNGFKVKKAIYISYPVIDKSVYDLTGDKQNLVVFKDRYVLPSVMRFRNRLMLDVTQGDIVVFYNMSYMYFGLAQAVKKKKANPVLMLADFTDYHEETNFVKKIIAGLCEKSFKQFDSIISLANFEKGMFKADAKIEILRGGINFKYFEDIGAPQHGQGGMLTFMYAGLLSNVTGVDVLLNAMKLVKTQNIKLLISGKGNLEETVKMRVKKDQRIEYLGFLDVDEYYKKLNEANVFINPRNMTLAQNRNNFPSKILEYLATGREIISTKFSGNEDFEGLVEWFDGSEEDLARKIDAMSQNYQNTYKERYRANREAAKKYDWNSQAMRIVRVVNR